MGDYFEQDPIQEQRKLDIGSKSDFRFAHVWQGSMATKRFLAERHEQAIMGT